MAVVKDLFKIYFNKMKKLLQMEEIFEKSVQNGFRQPENQFPLARMTDLLKNKFTLNGKKTTRSI